jgi:hypothetical protein
MAKGFHATIDLFKLRIITNMEIFLNNIITHGTLSE